MIRVSGPLAEVKAASKILRKWGYVNLRLEEPLTRHPEHRTIPGNGNHLSYGTEMNQPENVFVVLHLIPARFRTFVAAFRTALMAEEWVRERAEPGKNFLIIERSLTLNLEDLTNES